MIDLSNHSTIKNNQDKNASWIGYAFINGIDISTNFIEDVLSDEGSSIQISGVYNYDGYLVCGNEVLYVNSSSNDGTKTTLNVDRGMFGTVQQSLVNLKAYSVVYLDSLQGYSFKNTIESSQSNLFSNNVGQGRITIYDNPEKWAYYSNNREYKFIKNQRVFIFESVNSQSIKVYEGLTYDKIPNVKSQKITIEVKGLLHKFINEPIPNTTVYENKYVGEILEDLFPDFSVEYTNGIVQSDTISQNYISTKEFDSYGGLLNSLSKSTLCRLNFGMDNTISITTDLSPSKLSPVETINNNLIDISDMGNSQLVYNRVKGEFLERKPYIDFNNPDIFNGNYMKFFKNKTETDFNIIQDSEFQTHTFTGVETQYIEYGDYVLLKDDNYEFWGIAVDITETDITVAFGRDKTFKMQYRGYINNEFGGAYTTSNAILYYGKNEVPIVWKYAEKENDEEKSSMLENPILPVVKDTSTISITTDNDEELITIGDNSNINNYILSNNEYIKISGSEYDGVNTTLFVERAQLNTTQVNQDSSTATVIKYSNLDEVGGSFNFADIKDKTFSGIVANIDNIYNTWLDNASLLYNRDFEQSTTNIPVYLYSNTITDVNDVVNYTNFDNRNIEVNISKSETNDKDFDLTLYNNLTPLEYSSLDKIDSLEVLGSVIRVDVTDYNNSSAGDVLVIEEDDLEDFKWMITNKFQQGGNYYLKLNFQFPTKENGTNYTDILRYPNDQVVLFQEMYIRGNPVMEKSQSINKTNKRSQKRFGTQEFELESRGLSVSNMKLVTDYILNGYKGTTSDSTKGYIEIEDIGRLDLEVGDVVSLTEDIYTGLENQKALILEKDVSYRNGKRTVKYKLITIGNFTANSNNVNISTTLRYEPLVIPSYNHQGKDSTEGFNADKEVRLLTLTTNTGETIYVKEIPISNVNSSVDSVSNQSIDGENKTINLSVTHSTGTSSFKDVIFQNNSEGICKINGEYMNYIYTSNTATTGELLITKRGIYKTTKTEISVSDTIQYYQLLGGMTEEGFVSKSINLGNDNSYFKFDEVNGAQFKGDFEILSGSGISSLSDAGDLATSNTADFDTQVSGAEKPDNFATDNRTKVDYTYVKVGEDAVGTDKDGFLVDTNAYARITNTNNDLYFDAATNESYFRLNSNKVKLGKDAIGNEEDGVYFADDATWVNADNGLRLNLATDSESIDLKSTGSVNISNDSNVLNFDSTGNSSLKLNRFSPSPYYEQQIGSGLEDNVDNGVDAYDGFFMGNANLSNNSYIKYKRGGNLEIATYKIKILDNDIALGAGALSNIGSITYTGVNNTSIGINSMLDNLEGSNNVALGGSAGELITTGDSNIFIGTFSGAGIVGIETGNNNIYLGNTTTPSSSSASYEVAIGNNITGSGSNSITLGTTSGRSGVYDDLYSMGVYQATSASSANVYVDSNGKIQRSVSSSKFKKNIRDLEIDTSKIYELKGKTFEMINTDVTSHSFIAEENSRVLEEFASYDKEGKPEAINWNAITVSLVEEIKNQKKQIELLEERLSKLENK